VEPNVKQIDPQRQKIDPRKKLIKIKRDATAVLHNKDDKKFLRKTN